jgi:hypothetical protein|nr:MAG TPA: hypothetical protein [Caudoviricetes sp.]
MTTKPKEKFAGLPTAEQECVITIDRETHCARIYASDTRYINKLDKIYKRVRIHQNCDGITAVEYEVPEKLISFRSGVTTRVYTDEERRILSERMKKQRAKKA